MDILLHMGYIGMFLAALLAGSVFPWSSEAIMVALVAAGLDPVGLLIAGTVGNVIGSMFNFWVGHLGRMDWIERYLKVKRERIDQASRFVQGYGAWIGFFAFLPIIGSAITIVLGLMRANIPVSITSITIGKFLRYALLLWGTSFIF